MRVGLVALGALYGAGCLLPQEDMLLQTITPTNRSPWIRENRVTLNGAAARVLTSGNAPTCSLVFEATAEDPDVDDTVRWRYYVDFSDANRAPELEGTFTNTGTAQRAESPKLTVLDIANSPRFQIGTHVVTFMVFDGELGARDGPGSVPPPDIVPGGSDGGNPRYSDTVAWVVTVTNSGQCNP